MWIRWKDVVSVLSRDYPQPWPTWNLEDHLRRLRTVYEHGVWLTNFAGPELARILPDLLLKSPTPAERVPFGQPIRVIGYLGMFCRDASPAQPHACDGVQVVLHTDDGRRVLVSGAVIGQSVLMIHATRGDGVWRPNSEMEFEVDDTHLRGTCGLTCREFADDGESEAR